MIRRNENQNPRGQLPQFQLQQRLSQGELQIRLDQAHRTLIEQRKPVKGERPMGLSGHRNKG